VVLTHANILANSDGAMQGRRSSAKADTSLGWMPLTHDMGLNRFSPFHDVMRVCGKYLMPTDLFRAARVALDEVSYRTSACDRDLLAEFRLPAFPEVARRQVLDAST
jgi:acyl-CoA synthetase (AMP-forming)/AMP-acid ligase II